MLIVDGDLLDEGIENGTVGSDFQITKDGITYNFGNTGNKIFMVQIKNFREQATILKGYSKDIFAKWTLKKYRINYII